MEPEGSLPHLQEYTTCPYIQVIAFNPVYMLEESLLCASSPPQNIMSSLLGTFV
jgi:hypothetical protein